MTNKPSFLSLKDGTQIAYHKTIAKDNSKPGIIFVHGFVSDMEGSKSLALEKFCQEKGYGFIRFDCTGHGQSSGDITEGTIGQWAGNLVSVLDELAKGKQIIIGSSMGGWLMLLATLQRPGRIAGLIGIAAAPDFTEELIWNKLSEKEKSELLQNGIYYQPGESTKAPDEESEPYPITHLLVEEARSHILLGSAINITYPVRLIHGKKDTDVPFETSLRLKERLVSNNVEVILSKNSDHRMSEKEDICLITNTLSNLVKSLVEAG